MHMKDEPSAEHQALLQFVYLAPVGVVQFGNSGDIDMINPMSAQLLMPVAPDGMLSNLFDTLAAVAPELRGLVAGFTATGGTICRDHRVSLPHSGRPDRMPQVLAITLLRLDRNRLMGLVSDISAAVRQETLYRQNQAWLNESLRLAKEAANEAKTEFLSNISHELRTPMHAISSFAKLGLGRIEDASREKLQRYFENIDGSAARLNHLLDDLLDLARLEAGRMTYDLQRTDMRVLLQTCGAEFEALTRSRGIVIESRFTPLDTLALVDGVRVRQVFTNLLANAVRFSPDRGAVVITLGITRDAGGGNQIVMTVADEGPGIPPAELELIFDKFVQSSKTKTGGGGTGLGLAIAREILTAHGGSVRAANRPHGGAEFRVELPAWSPVSDPAAGTVAAPEVVESR